MSILPAPRPNPESNPILEEWDYTSLKAQFLLFDANLDDSKTVLIHERCQTSESDLECTHLARNNPFADAFVHIPRHLVSWETLIYFGLSANKAEEIWNLWAHSQVLVLAHDIPAPGIRARFLPPAFLDFVLDCLVRKSGVPDAGAHDDDTKWYECLVACGIHPVIQMRFMDPAGAVERRQLGTCLDFVRVMIKARYDELQRINKASRVRDQVVGIRNRLCGSLY